MRFILHFCSVVVLAIGKANYRGGSCALLPFARSGVSQACSLAPEHTLCICMVCKAARRTLRLAMPSSAARARTAYTQLKFNTVVQKDTCWHGDARASDTERAEKRAYARNSDARHHLERRERRRSMQCKVQ